MTNMRYSIGPALIGPALIGRALIGRGLVVSVLAATVVCLSTSLRSHAESSSSVTIPARNQLASGLIGTWVLEKAKSPGKPSGIGTRLKMFTGTHWSVLQPDPKTGKIIFCHGGRYSVDGGQVTTHTDFAGDSTTMLIGKTNKLKLNVTGNTMKQQDAAGVFDETWTRAK